MCLIRLMLATVMLFVQINQNMDHIADQKLGWKSLCFNFSCLAVICIDIAYNVYKKVGCVIRKTYQC